MAAQGSAAIKAACVEGRTIPVDALNAIHGLRYTAAARLREIGLDWKEIAAITGRQTAEMARKYSRRKRTAEPAVVKLDSALSSTRR